MFGNIIYGDVICIEDNETKHQYPLHITSVFTLNCCNNKNKKAVKSASYIIRNNEAIILNVKR